MGQHCPVPPLKFKQVQSFRELVPFLEHVPEYQHAFLPCLFLTPPPPLSNPILKEFYVMVVL
jgi:hypothetical protein